MEPRSFLLPTTAALSLALTSACGPAIVGDWDLTQVTFGAETYDYPATYNGTYDGHTYDIAVSGLLTMAKDLTGAFETTYSYTLDAGTPEVTEESYAAVATKVSGKEYGIAIAEMELDLSCTIDGPELTCTDGSAEEETTFVFDKSAG